MNILVIPEDFRKDQYILKPLFSRLFRRLGTPNPQVVVCRDPLLGGIDEALKTDKLAEIVSDQQGMTDIFILCVDRDGAVGRRQRLDRIEAEFQGRCVFFAENAWQEVETWALAGLSLPAEWRWSGRKGGSPSEGTVIFEPLGRQTQPGQRHRIQSTGPEFRGVSKNLASFWGRSSPTGSRYPPEMSGGL